MSNPRSHLCFCRWISQSLLRSRSSSFSDVAHGREAREARDGMMARYSVVYLYCKYNTDNTGWQSSLCIVVLYVLFINTIQIRIMYCQTLARTSLL